MIKKVITDNSSEKITVRWDGTRFALVHHYKNDPPLLGDTQTLILNPKEMMSLINFAGTLGQEE